MLYESDGRITTESACPSCPSRSLSHGHLGIDVGSFHEGIPAFFQHASWTTGFPSAETSLHSKNTTVCGGGWVLFGPGLQEGVEGAGSVGSLGLYRAPRTYRAAWRGGCGQSVWDWVDYGIGTVVYIPLGLQSYLLRRWDWGGFRGSKCAWSSRVHLLLIPM